MNKKSTLPHIAIYLPNLNGGGVERMVLNLIMRFHDLGYPITLLLARKEGMYVDLVPNWLDVVDFDTDGLLGPVLPLKRWIKTHKPDVVLSCLTVPNLSLLLAKLLLPKDFTRFIISPRSIYTEDRKLTPPHKAFIKYNLVKILYPLADALICISNVVRDNQIAHYRVPAEKAVTIYNPAFTDSIVQKSQEPCDHPWLTQKECPVIFTMGRLSTQKGFDLLIPAFAKLREKQIARLIILGEGEDHEMLRDLAHAHGVGRDVDLPGFHTNPFCFMANSDLFILSSRYEGFGNVMIEALGCGLPVIATNSGSAYEILGDQKWGKVIANKDIDEMAQALENMLNKPYPSKIERLNRAKDFSVETIADQYLKILGPQKNASA